MEPHQVLQSIYRDLKQIKADLVNVHQHAASLQLGERMPAKIASWVKDTQVKLWGYHGELQSDLIQRSASQHNLSKVLGFFGKVSSRVSDFANHINPPPRDQQRMSIDKSERPMSAHYVSQTSNYGRIVPNRIQSTDMMQVRSSKEQKLNTNTLTSFVPSAMISIESDFQVAVTLQRKSLNSKGGPPRASMGPEIQSLKKKSIKNDKNASHNKTGTRKYTRNAHRDSCEEDRIRTLSLSSSSRDRQNHHHHTRTKSPTPLTLMVNNGNALKTMTQTPTVVDLKQNTIDTAMTSIDSKDRQGDSCRVFPFNDKTRSISSKSRSKKLTLVQAQLKKEIKSVWDNVEREKDYNRQLDLHIQKALQNSEIRKNQKEGAQSTLEIKARQQELQQEYEHIMRQQVDAFAEKDQKLKRKLQKYKDRTKRKVDEYKEYIRQLKFNIDSLIQEKIEIKAFAAERSREGERWQGLLEAFTKRISYALEIEEGQTDEDEIFNVIASQKQTILDLKAQLKISENQTKQLQSEIDQLKTEWKQNHKTLSGAHIPFGEVSQNGHTLSHKTLELTQRFDRLKLEIQKKMKGGKSETGTDNSAQKPSHPSQSVTPYELHKFQHMLENIQGKLECKAMDTENREIRKDLELAKQQMQELQDFHFRLKEMSPIPAKKQRQLHLHTTDSKVETETPNYGGDDIVVQRTRGFKLGIAKDSVDQSSCFDTLHELCNIQIDELKKQVKMTTNERDSALRDLDFQRDSYQALLNEKMEIEMHFNSKTNEVTYLHKYLDDYEREVQDLKQVLEDQERTLNEEKTTIIDKLNKTKEKKHQLQQRVEMQETSSYYHGGGGTNQSSCGTIEVASLKCENEHLKQLSENQNQRIKILENYVNTQKTLNSSAESGAKKIPSVISRDDHIIEESQFHMLLKSHSPSPFKMQQSMSQQYLNVPQLPARHSSHHSQERIPSKPSNGKPRLPLTLNIQEEQSHDQSTEQNIQLNQAVGQRNSLTEDELEENTAEEASTSNQRTSDFNRANSIDHMPPDFTHEDIRKVIRYEEMQFSNNPQGNSCQSSSNVTPLLTPCSNQVIQGGTMTFGQPAYPLTLGGLSSYQHASTTSLTTRNQRMKLKELELTSNRTKKFQFDTPESSDRFSTIKKQPMIN